MTTSSGTPTPVYFLITSSGAAATRWLGSTLNAHPEICCSCGPGTLEIALDYDREVTPAELERIAAFHLEHSVGAGPEAAPIDAMFDLLETHRPAAVYGNIHAETVSSLARKLEALPSRRRPGVVNLIRHPIPRTESKFHILQGDAAASPGMARLSAVQFAGRLQRFPLLAERIADQIGNFLEDPAQASFVNALFDTLEGMSEFSTPGLSDRIPHVLIERVQRDGEEFRSLFSRLTAGRVELSDSFLEWVYSAANLRRGRASTGAVAAAPPRAAAEQWEAWEEWQRRAFRSAMDVHQLHLPYLKQGYEFGFVPEASAPRHPGLGARIPGLRRSVAPRVASPSLFNQMP